MLQNEWSTLLDLQGGRSELSVWPLTIDIFMGEFFILPSDETLDMQAVPEVYIFGPTMQLEDNAFKKNLKYRMMVSAIYYYTDSIRVLTRHEHQLGFLGYSAPLASSSWVFYLVLVSVITVTLHLSNRLMRTVDDFDLVSWSMLFHYDSCTLLKSLRSLKGGMEIQHVFPE